MKLRATAYDRDIFESMVLGNCSKSCIMDFIVDAVFKHLGLIPQKFKQVPGRPYSVESGLW